MSKPEANLGRGKQFDELTSNSKNIHWFVIWCVTEKRKLSCVWSSISWLNHNGNFYFLLLIAFPSKPTLLNEVQARELEQLKDKNINFTQLMFTSNPLSLWQELFELKNDQCIPFAREKESLPLHPRIDPRRKVCMVRESGGSVPYQMGDCCRTLYRVQSEEEPQVWPEHWSEKGQQQL